MTDSRADGAPGGRPGTGDEDDDTVIDRLLAAADARDQAADQRDRCAAERDATARLRGDPGAGRPPRNHPAPALVDDLTGDGPIGGPDGVTAEPTDDAVEDPRDLAEQHRSQHAIDRVWAGRDRDAAAVDRAELIGLRRRARAREQGRAAGSAAPDAARPLPADPFSSPF